MLRAWNSSMMTRQSLVCLLSLCALLVAPSLMFAASGSPYTGSGVPWAPSSATKWVTATAAIGVDPPLTQNWSASQILLPASSAGVSFSSVPYAASNGDAPFNRSAYTATSPATIATVGSYMGSANWSTQNVAQYYPTGVQPSGSAAMNVSNLGYVAASSVVYTTGGTTDTYPNGPKLNLYGSGYYSPGTQAAIIAGTFVPTTPTTNLTISWRTRSQNEMLTGTSTSQNLPTTAAYLASDVMTMSGQTPGNDFVLEMSFSPEVEQPSDQMFDIQANKGLFLGMLVNQNGLTTWANAVTENVANTASETSYNSFLHRYSTIYENLPATGAYAWHPTTTNPADAGIAGDQWVDSTKPSSQPFIGSFQQFLNSTYLEGGQVHYFYEHSLDELRGTWGIDTSTDTAWAVLDVGNGIFAVVPEPATIRLVAACLMTTAIAVWWRRRSRIKAVRAKAGKNTESAKSIVAF